MTETFYKMMDVLHNVFSSNIRTVILKHQTNAIFVETGLENLLRHVMTEQETQRDVL